VNYHARREASSRAVPNSVETKGYSLISLSFQLYSSVEYGKAPFSATRETLTTSKHTVKYSENKVYRAIKFFKNSENFGYVGEKEHLFKIIF
jgi:hypothetical protein